MIVILVAGIWDTKERLSGDNLEQEAAKAPDVESIVDSSLENVLWGSQSQRGNNSCGRVGKEIRCFGIQALVRPSSW